MLYFTRPSSILLTSDLPPRDWDDRRLRKAVVLDQPELIESDPLTCGSRLTHFLGRDRGAKDQADRSQCSPTRSSSRSSTSVSQRHGDAFSALLASHSLRSLARRHQCCLSHARALCLKTDPKEATASSRYCKCPPNRHPPQQTNNDIERDFHCCSCARKNTDKRTLIP
jgi:hypothetical protein